jgi:hypothetical protein
MSRPYILHAKLLIIFEIIKQNEEILQIFPYFTLFSFTNSLIPSFVQLSFLTPFILQKLIIIADIISGIIMLAREAEENCAGREVIQVTPDARDDI